MKISGTLHRVLSTSALTAAKRAELASIDGVAIPKMYFAIGKKLSALENLPVDLEPLRRRIVALLDPMANGVESPTAESSGYGGWLGRYLRRAGRVAADAGAAAKVTAAYIQLGQMAVGKYGEQAVPKELRTDWVELSDRRTAIMAVIADLESSQGYGWLTVRRVATAGLIGVPVLAVFLLVLWLGYPLLAIYALIRAAVLVAVVVAVYRLCAALVAYVRAVASSTSGQARVAEGRRLKHLAVYTAVGILAIYVLPVPKAPRRSDAGYAMSSVAAMRDNSGQLSQDRPAARAPDARPEMTADMFMNLIFQAAAMDQLARQTMPRLSPTYAPSSPQPSIRGLQPTTPYIDSQYGGVNARGGQPRQMQQWEGVCSRCGYRTGRQAVRGNSRQACIQFNAQGRPCGGVIIWEPAQGF